MELSDPALKLEVKPFEPFEPFKPLTLPTECVIEVIEDIEDIEVIEAIELIELIGAIKDADAFSYAANISTVPDLSAVTMPVLETTAMLGSLEVQTMFWSVALDGANTAAKVSLPPAVSVILCLLGAMFTAGIGTATTVTAHSAIRLP
jgi:hypothetical protein